MNKKPQVIIFRVDASLKIGTGHVMRCLTLANHLKRQGALCLFICRANSGDQITQIKNLDHQVLILPSNNQITEAQLTVPSDIQSLDAQECVNLLKDFQVSCLIVDHYALDSTWEGQIRPYCGSLMVIDDLANRPHHCDLLLDQNLGTKCEDYNQLIPESCKLLLGPKYALLRPEFSQARDLSIQHRSSKLGIKNWLVTLGGVDEPNYTARVLSVLKSAPLAPDTQITLIAGSKCPHINHLQLATAKMPYPTRLITGTDQMAQLMAESDIAIGAGGSTSWERCSLGLPTIQLIVADNQLKASQALHQAGAVITIDARSPFESKLLQVIQDLLLNPTGLNQMSQACLQVTSGRGIFEVTQHILSTP